MPPPPDPPFRPADAAITILLVDDERPLRELLRRTLLNAGYEVLVAVNGAEGADVAGESGRRIHLLVTDVAMPVMNGEELAARFRVLHPNVPILFMSGLAGHSQDGALLPGESFLPKPFGLATFLEKVREMLG